MTRDDILRIARESGLEFHDEISDPWTVLLPELTRFAELVAAAEREACAKVIEEWNTAMTDKFAAEIRARGER